MPISMIRPIMDGMDSAFCVTNRATKAPPMLKGKAAKMVAGCMKSWNSSTSTP